MASLTRAYEPPHVGSTYPTWAALRHAITDWSVYSKFAFRTPVKDNQRCLYICNSKDCKWRLRGTLKKPNEVVEITMIASEHTCAPGAEIVRPHVRRANNTQSWVRQKIAQKMVIDKKTTCDEIRKVIRSEFGEEITHNVAMRAKRWFLKENPNRIGLAPLTAAQQLNETSQEDGMEESNQGMDDRSPEAAVNGVQAGAPPLAEQQPMPNAIAEPTPQAESISDLMREVRDYRSETRAGFGEMRTRIAASDSNIARLANSHIINPEELLHQLNDVSTNATIPYFPSTPSALDALSAPAVGYLLRCLGLGLEGDENHNRWTLRLGIGLRP